MNKQVDFGANVLIYVVRNFRSKVVALLLRNGVVVPSGSTDVQVAQLVTELLKVSKSFNADFMKLLATPEVLSGFTSMDGYSSMDGYYNAYGDFDTSLGYKSQFATTDFLTKKPVSDMANKAIDDNKKKPFDWGKVIEGLQFGVTSYLQADKNKTDRALADASVKTSGNQVLMTQGGGTGGVTTTGGSNTVLWVVLGVVGLGLVGTVVYFATKK